jgi:signal transduction histidine kinase
MNPISVLIVDDKKGLAELMASRLSNEGWDVRTAQSGEAALRILQSEPIDILAADYSMPPGMTGAVLVNQALALKPDLYSIIFTALRDERDTAVQSLRAGVAAFIDKTADGDEDLRAAIKRGIQLITLTRFGRKLLDVDSEAELLDLMVESLRRFKQFDGCCLAVREGRETYRVERAVDFKTGHELDHEQIHDANSAYRYVIRTGLGYLPPLVGPEEQTLQPFLPESRSIAVVPIVLKAGEKGALGIEHRKQNRLTVEDLRFLNQIAYWVTLAMEKLTQQDRVRLEEMRSRHRRYLLAQAALHDIKNPLNNLAIAVQSAAGYLPSELAKSLLDSAGRINAAVNKNFDSAMGSAKSVREELHVGEVIDEALLSFRLSHPAKPIPVVADVSSALPTIVGDRDMFLSIMLNLLENGATATANTGRPPELYVTANYVRARDQVEIVVRDNGCGIPDGLIERVFDYGMTTGVEHGHMGYGLAFTREMVNQNGGGITVSSTEGEGTSFKLAFPVGSLSVERRASEHT